MAEMSKRILQQILRRLYQPHAHADGSVSAQVEERTMAAYTQHFGRQRRSHWFPRSVLARTALASVLVIAMLGVACELPTQATVDMGQRVVVVFQPPGSNADIGALESRLHTALKDAGAEKVRILVGHTDERRLQLDIVAWDEHLTPDAVEAILQAEIGKQNILTVDFTTLSGTVSETLGRRMMRQVFGVSVSEDTAEALRAAILEGLAEQGFDGEAQVEVQDDGSMRTITIEAGTADGTQQISDEVIIDRKDN